MDLTKSGGASWQRLVAYLLSELDRRSVLLSSPIARGQIESMIMGTLLLSQPHRYSNHLLKPAAPIAPAFIRRAERFIESNADQPLTAAEIAMQVGVSLSTLFAGFQEYRHITPMFYLKQVRLQRVRDLLLAAAPGAESVTRIATQWGFTHLGRFATDYRRKFGELPSETLRR
ncbi:Helix-turn-helix domain protein [compost metagenome]